MGMFDDMLDEGMQQTQEIMKAEGLDYNTARKKVGIWPSEKEKPKMKIYIAGPMRGYANFNFQSFYDAEEWLTSKGYEVFNPARVDVEFHGADIHTSNATGDELQAAQQGLTGREALTRDAAMIAQSDALYMLVGWENSAGAQAEWALAKAMRVPHIFYQGGIEDFEYKPEGAVQ